MPFDIYTFIEAMWLILPAYAANGLVPLVGKLKNLHPIDGGRVFRDGRPLLGQGKSWEGLFTGSLIGSLIATVEMLAFPYLPFDASPVPLTIVTMSPFLGFLLGLGAMLGDIAASFLKRRLNLKRGAPAPVLDQDDFVLGSLLFASLLIPLKPDWFLMLLIVTPLFHITANLIAYKLGIKNQPW